MGSKNRKVVGHVEGDRNVEEDRNGSAFSLFLTCFSW